jgi:predicted Zn-ribbon and HTH transcriptional regulator
MPEPFPKLTDAELAQWQNALTIANYNNILHHCRQCGYEWVASGEEACRCGSQKVERIACWQFPDD